MGEKQGKRHNKLDQSPKDRHRADGEPEHGAGGEIAQNLKSLYVYMHMRLVEANIEKQRRKSWTSVSGY